MAKPNGKNKKPNYSGLKTARAEGRQKCAETGYTMWPLCWNKFVGYYAPDHHDGNADTICYIDKGGFLTYVPKKILKEHNFKMYMNPPWYNE